MSTRKGPVLIEMTDGPTALAGPDVAPPVPDPGDAPRGRAMQTLAVIAARPPSRLARWFWRLLLALAGFGLSLWAWNLIEGLIARNQILGYAALGLAGAFVLVCLGIILREWAAFARLGRLDRLQAEAQAARTGGDLAAARRLTARLAQLYRGRPDLQWGQQRLAERQDEVMDAEALLALAEAELLSGLDEAAMRQIEAAARQVATVTAIVPLALADVLAALTANVRMIRRIAEIYGGRSGTLGSLRLSRVVLSHLVATGAVAVGDDLVGSIAGGGVLSRVSRRFGEGVINGALTARVGVAAMEVCRPMPFGKGRRPGVTGLVQRALAGLFARTG